MSWQEYVDNSLLGSGKILKATILGHDGSIWAQSPQFELSAPERAVLVQAFEEPSRVRQEGLRLAGEKYLVLRTDGRSIYAKIKDGGAICVKTGQAILVGIYGEGATPGEATKLVEELADYLLGVGY